MAMGSFAEQVTPPQPKKLEEIENGGFFRESQEENQDEPKITRLTQYLEYETWTPEQGAYLISGIFPVTVNHPHYCGKIASLADGEIIQNPQYHLDWANVVLTKWKQRENPPAKVRPINFINWCKSQGIDTGWVTNADEWADYVQRQRPAISDHEKMFEEIEKRHWEQYETDPEYRAKYVAEQVKRNSEREQEEAEEIKARIESGRYTFKEAAKLIANNSRSTSDSIYSKLEQAALDGKLAYYAPSMDEVYKRIRIKNWYELLWSDLNKWLDDNEQLIVYRFPEPEAFAQSERPNSKKIEVDPIFSKFADLRPNEISVVIMENNTAKMMIRGKKITVCPSQLGLKVDSQGWKLLQGAAVRSGDLTESLKVLNKTSNLEAEKGKIKKAIYDLRGELKRSMGLIDNPISYLKKGGYRFAFKDMIHETWNGGRVTKESDALDYACREVKEYDRSYIQNFEEEYDDELDSKSDY